MRKTILCLPIFALWAVAAWVSAQEAYGGYSYPRAAQDQWYAPAQRSSESRMRWRPLEDTADEESARDPSTPQEGGRFDYTDEPFGLPRGVYRQIEERHTITPQLPGYRFRPIDPDEQVRNRERNESQDRVYREMTQDPPRGQESDPYYRGQQAPDLRFRPDPRLDRSSRMPPARYGYPQGAQSPQFRPR